MRKGLIWFFIFIAISLILIGLSFSLYNKFSVLNRKEAKDTFAFKHSVPFNILIIGDSIARGAGDETGNGFSTYIPEYLKSNIPGNISVLNAGVDGLKSTGLLEQLKSGKLNSQLAGSNMIVLSIGGNDLLALYSFNDIEKATALKSIQTAYMENLKEILKIIREHSPDSLIVSIGLYNPAEDGVSILNNLLLNNWNDNTRKLVEEETKAVFIETNDIFKTDLKSNISSDKLHPSSFGYRAVSERISKLADGMKRAPVYLR